MASRLPQVIRWVDSWLPPHSSRRKLAQLLSIILVVEGLSILFLFSYVGRWLGLFSLLAGAAFLSLLRSGHRTPSSEFESPGSRLIGVFVKLLGGEYAVMASGAALVFFFVFGLRL